MLFEIIGYLAHSDNILDSIIYSILILALFVCFIMMIVAVGIAVIGIGSCTIELVQAVRHPEPETELNDSEERIIREYIRKINKLHFSNEKMEDNIHKFVAIISQISILIDEKPERAKKCRRFSLQYLPIAVDLLEEYQKMEQMTIQGKNIQESKADVEKAVDMILEAFQNLANDLTSDIPIGVKANVDVLHTLLVQDGLLDNYISTKNRVK